MPHEEEIYDVDGNLIEPSEENPTADHFAAVMEQAQAMGQDVLNALDNTGVESVPEPVARQLAELVISLAEQNIRTYNNTLIASYTMVNEAWKTGLSAGVDYSNNQTYGGDLPPNPYQDERLDKLAAEYIPE